MRQGETARQASLKPGPICGNVKHLGLFSLLALLLTVLVGCAVGPKYQAPKTEVSPAWDGQTFVTAALPSKTTTDPARLVEWWDVGCNW